MGYLIAIGLAVVLFLLWAERGRLFRISTWHGLRAGGLKNLLNLRAVHMYIYGRWPVQYIKASRKYIIPRLDEEGKLRLAESYHSKILTPKLAQNIITINKSIPMQELEQVIPYPAARKIVLDHPLDIAVMECPCRAGSPNPCTPSQVCMVIGKPFTDFVLEHHPGSSRRLTQKEALKLLEEVHRRGCVHTAWFKDACFERFYVICNCCKCCCAGLQAMVTHGIPMVLSSGYVAHKDNEACNGCGLCQKVCPFEAVDDSLAIDSKKCMGCGVCATKCKQNVISLRRDKTKGVPLDVNKLNQKDS